MQVKLFALIVIAAAALQGGCRDNVPEVPPVPPPAPGRDTYNRDYEPRKPQSFFPCRKPARQYQRPHSPALRPSASRGA